jgi:ABC-type glycerol-3-phosphate transport system substrate-binding protein
MANLTRRSLLRNSFGLVTAGTLSRPYIANAASKTATVWWVQGFAEEEDVAFKNTVIEYEKASGNTIDYTLMPFAPHRQKIVSALTSGVVPDLFPNNPVEILALYAWDNKLVDVGDASRLRAPRPRSAPKLPE